MRTKNAVVVALVLAAAALMSQNYKSDEPDPRNRGVAPRPGQPSRYSATSPGVVWIDDNTGTIFSGSTGAWKAINLLDCTTDPPVGACASGSVCSGATSGTFFRCGTSGTWMSDKSVRVVPAAPTGICSAGEVGTVVQVRQTGLRYECRGYQTLYELGYGYGPVWAPVTPSVGRSSTRGFVRDLPTVVLRFDDGAYSQKEIAWEMMKSRGIPGSFFINTGRFGLGPPGSAPLYCSALTGIGDAAGDGFYSAASVHPERIITQTEAQLMAAEGADMQSHGSTHLDITSNGKTPFNSGYATVLAEWKADRNSFAGLFGYEPEVYGVPFNHWTPDWAIAASPFFDYVGSITPGYSPDRGLMATGDRTWTGASVPTEAGMTGSNLCQFIKDAVIPSRNAVWVLAFHCISAAGEPIDTVGNSYPEDEFAGLLDCLQFHRDSGQIAVLPYKEAFDSKRQPEQRGGLLLNPRYGDPSGSTTTAPHWGATTNVTFESNEDLYYGRQAKFSGAAGSSTKLIQRISNLEPGSRYIISQDVEWDANSAACSDAEATVNLYVRAFSGGGGPTTANGAVQHSAGVSDAGAGDGFRRLMTMEFNAPETFVEVGTVFAASAGACLAAGGQRWIVRYPSLRKVEAIQGQNTFSQQREWPALVPFKIITSLNGGAAIAAGGGAVNVDIPVLNNMFANWTGASILGPGPTKFLITRIIVDEATNLNAPGADLKFYGRTAAGGDLFWQKLAFISDWDSQSDALPLVGVSGNLMIWTEDNDGINEYFSSVGPSTEGTGNNLHVRFVNNDAAQSTIVTLTVEGLILK